MRKLLLLSLPALALVAAGCGNDVPPNGVAKVGDTVITKASFDHWLGAAAKGQQAPGQTAASTVPDAPKFTKCAAAKAKQKLPKGAPKPTPKQLTDQCKQEYDGLKDQVLQFLISSEWIQQEAEKRDIEATDAEVKKRFEDQKKQSFPDAKQYQEFLKTSGQTEADLLFRVKLDVLTNEVRKKVIGDEGKVSDDDIKEYYEKNKARFSQPERRDLLVVLTKKESEAEAAKKLLEKGTAFKKVAKKYSIDDASKAQGGKLPGVAKGQQEKAFDTAIFKAKKGVVTGPVKTQFGFYVFEVSKIVPKTQQSLEKSKETIKNLLKSQGEQKALDRFIKDFQKNYKDETNCAKGFVIQDCKNAPKPKTQSGPASGGAPGAPPQGAPPGAGGAPPQGAPPGAGGAPPQGVPPGAGGPPPQGAPPQGAPPQGAPPGAGGPPPQGAPPQGAPPGGQQVPVQP